MRSYEGHISLMLVWLSRGLTALVVLVALGAGSCGGDRPRTPRVLVVGIDGATFRVAGPLLASGKLPNLAGIAAEGVSGPLRSALPLASPRIWNTISTGKIPEKHGIISFAHPGKDGAPQLYLSSDRKTHALWNIVSDAGLTVGVVNWWNTYPPARINGVIVSDHLIPAEVEARMRLARAKKLPRASVVFPESWRDRIAHIMRIDAPLTTVPNPFRSDAGFPRWVRRSLERLEKRFSEDGLTIRIALEIEDRIQPDLLMVFLPGIDRISHFLWGCLEPPDLYPARLRPTVAEREAGANAIRAYYEYTDALIGLLLERYDRQDLVLVVSDHGFEAGVELMSLTGVHESENAIDGVLFARGANIGPPGPAGSVTIHDITPTVLAWLGLPVAEDMDGRPADFLVNVSVKRISTYDTEPIARVSSDASGAEERLIEQLRGLGYLE
ncbi:MAG: alkaline phosphatase family protein [Myxococcota bacterium]